ncbi:MAG: PilZ domain-containing protein [Deltaproteobacteria bacterium]|nr:PilZ domain-containing protein [Deltaproteobacteria bacterium]
MDSGGRDTQRREARYSVEVEVHLTDGVQELATRTREISRSGLFAFACPAPPVGKELRVTLYPRGGAVLHLDGRVRYRLPDIGAGISVFGQDDALARYQGFVASQAQAVLAWHAIRGFLAEEDVHASSGYYEARELIPIGERCQALQILFERFPGRPAEERISEAGGTRLERDGEKLKCISQERLGLKLHADDRLREVFVGQTDRGHFVAVIPPGDDNRELALYRLGGREHIAISAGGHSIFPHFTPSDLLAIRRAQVEILGSAYVQDTAFERSPTHGDAPHHAQSAELSRWHRFDDGLARRLLELFRRHQHETRVYSIRGVSREVKFLRDLSLEIRAMGPLESRESARLLHDGRRLCVVLGSERSSWRVRPLSEGDEVRLLGLAQSADHSEA